MTVGNFASDRAALSQKLHPLSPTMRQQQENNLTLLIALLPLARSFLKEVAKPCWIAAAIAPAAACHSGSLCLMALNRVRWSQRGSPTRGREGPPWTSPEGLPTHRIPSSLHDQRVARSGTIENRSPFQVIALLVNPNNPARDQRSQTQSADRISRHNRYEHGCGRFR
jgi:hypothetical protein